MYKLVRIHQDQSVAPECNSSVYIYVIYIGNGMAVDSARCTWKYHKNLSEPHVWPYNIICHLEDQAIPCVKSKQAIPMGGLVQVSTARHTQTACSYWIGHDNKLRYLCVRGELM